MEISKITIKGLFKTFTHEIELSNGVQIIMGENGVGKTVTMKLIEAIFNKDFRYLCDTEFDTISIRFKSRLGTWNIRRWCDPEYGKHLEFKTTAKNQDSFNVASYELPPMTPDYLEKQGEDRWRDLRTNRLMTSAMIKREYGLDSEATYDKYLPEWFSKRLETNRIKFIKAQRVFAERFKNETAMNIELYAKDMLELLQTKMTKVNETTSSIDNSFPIRLLRQLRSHQSYTAEEIKQELDDLHTRRQKLMDVGIMKDTQTDWIDSLHSVEKDNTALNVLHLYIKDSREKLAEYEAFAEKINKFVEIINNHLKRKRLSIDYDKGFVVKAIEGEKDSIKLSRLSSGEQNEIVLIYELLFKCDNKDLILVDEPEISLHLEWLQNMIKDMLDITKLSKSSMLIATHSPDLVGNYYNLVTNLE